VHAAMNRKRNRAGIIFRAFTPAFSTGRSFACVATQASPAPVYMSSSASSLSAFACLLVLFLACCVGSEATTRGVVSFAAPPTDPCLAFSSGGCQICTSHTELGWLVITRHKLCGCCCMSVAQVDPVLLLVAITQRLLRNYGPMRLWPLYSTDMP
jgi:hypothetical protein